MPKSIVKTKQSKLRVIWIIPLYSIKLKDQ